MKNRIVISLLFTLLSVTVWAQAPPPPPDPSDVPIDGGLSFLVVGGIAYGTYQLKKRKQKRDDSI